MNKIFAGARIFHNDRLLIGFALEVINNQTVRILPDYDLPKNSSSVIWLSGGILTAGFIETQANGGGGILINQHFDDKSLAIMADAHRKFGTVAILPTFITDEKTKYHQAINSIADAVKNKQKGIIGGHFEGPFINLEKKGTHQAKFIRKIDDSDFLVYQKNQNYLQNSIITLAPECVEIGAIAKIKPFIPQIQLAHSMAGHIDIERAYCEGLTGITHLFNAMKPFSGRDPAIIGTACALGLYAGIITDAIHSHYYALRSAYQLLGKDKLMLVTDSMHTINAPKIKDFDLLGIKVFVKQDRLINENGNLAGAHINMLQSVQNAYKFMQLSIEQVLTMAITTPARYLNLNYLANITNRNSDDILYLSDELTLKGFLTDYL